MFNYRKFLNTKSKRAFGIIGIALTLGATGALVGQNSSQNIARNSTGNATMRNSQLKRDNQRLKTTFDLVNMTNDDYCEWLRIYAQEHEPPEFCVELRKDWEFEEMKRKVELLEVRMGSLESRLDSIDTKLNKLDQLDKLDQLSKLDKLDELDQLSKLDKLDELGTTNALLEKLIELLSNNKN